MNTLWREPAALVLASASASRASLLASTGIPFEQVPAEIDERSLEAEHGGNPLQTAQILAQEKALAVSRRLSGRLVLGADQTLEIEGAALHKPADRAGARAQLLQLRGKEHRLASALALARDGQPLWQGVACADLRMRGFSDAFLELYLDLCGENALASVGGYQLEGLGVHLFEHVSSEHSTVLGLPLLTLLPALRALGALRQ